MATDRREFLGLALTTATGAVLWPLFPRSAFAQQGAACAAIIGAALQKVPEIASGTIVTNASIPQGVLRAVVDLAVETRGITEYGTSARGWSCRQHTLRAYRGVSGFDPMAVAAITPSPKAMPGPTFRARVGDKVQLIFLNRINPSQFNQTSVTSARDKCDTSFSAQSGGGIVYPGANDKFPNCFHASNTSNMHYHGFHVTPGAFGDNVLIGVLPNHALDIEKAIGACREALGSNGHDAAAARFAKAASDALLAMKEAAEKSGNTELTAQLTDAIQSNQQNSEAGEWPQYWPGFYPYSFELPINKEPGKFPVMGQSPGTHWYHCHQHGSTTAQILNGMAGLFIIEGDYDDKLKAAMPGVVEQVMIFQLFQEQPNLVNQTLLGVKSIVAVNGQAVPTVKMKTGEVQRWRIANAAMRANGIDQYLFVSEDVFKKLVDPATKPSLLVKGQPPPSASGSVPRLYQTAQDGVQFSWKAFDQRKPVVAADAPTELATYRLAPGNRMDFLVQAPATAGNAYLIFWPAVNATGGFTDININYVLKVVVEKGVVDDDGKPTYNTLLPNEGNYPPMPADLGDITDAEVARHQRKVTFSMTGVVGPGAGPRVNPPQFFIDGKQFSEGVIDQVMLLGTAEEWTVENTSLEGVSHPFHIHINPFQIVEVFDPATMAAPKKIDPPVWSDTVSIPAQFVAGGPPGHVKIRHRFVDFPGKFVLHCHILGHEDRGMMQMVEVVDNRTVVKHH